MTFSEFITALEKGLGTTIETEGDAAAISTGKRSFLSAFPGFPA